MASGYFPEVIGDFAPKLRQAVAMLQEVIADWYESRGVLSAEDAARDQSYVDGLVLAIEKIEDCIAPDTTDPAVVEKLLKAAEKRREEAESEVDRLSEIQSKLRSRNLLNAIEADPARTREITREHYGI